MQIGADRPLLESREMWRESNGQLDGSPRELVNRPRLLARLAEVRSARLTVVHAPAGYGKSSLLRQWYDALRGEDAGAVWLTIHPSHREPLEFLSHLVSGVEAQLQIALPSFKSFLAGGANQSADVVASRVADALRCVDGPIFLFLDDVHKLAGSLALAYLQALIEYAPTGLHIVISARARPDIPLARLRARGELAELTAHELRFAGGEIAALLVPSGIRDLTGQELQILLDRSDGWAAGLKLAALALACGGNRTEILHSFSGERSAIWEFFTEDVLLGQREEIQDFLLKTSVVEQICAPLCDALTGQKNGRALLDDCERTGLFLFPLDDMRTWYRFHPLFREFLQRRFRDRLSSESAVLHGRASTWFLAAGMQVEAFDHAMKANDPIRAAEILDQQLDAMFGAGQAATIGRLAGELPAHIQAFYPRITLAAAWSKIAFWKFAEVRQLLTISRARLSELERLKTLSKSEITTIEHLLQHREMMLDQFQDNMLSVEDRGNALIGTYPDAHPFVAGSIHSAHLHSRREQYKLREVDRLDANARSFLTQCNGAQALIAHEAIVGAARFMGADTELALEQLRRGLEISLELFGPAAPIGAMCALPLAEVLYERNDVDRARALLDEYLPVADKFGFVDQLISGWITQSRLLRLKGDQDGALKVLAAASTFAVHSGFERLGYFAAAEQLRQLLRTGRSEEAARVARRIGIKSPPSAVMPIGRITTRDEAKALIWIHWAETQNRIADALNVARQWRTFTDGAGAIRSSMRWSVAIANLLLLDGQFRSAKRTLRHAISTAVHSGVVRSFLDEPSLLRALFGDTLSGEPHPVDKTDEFVWQLMTALEHEQGRKVTSSLAVKAQPAGLGGPLSVRELEVLRLTAGGMSNREAGDRLGMTEGSVKWHLQQIYDKIGVRRRLQAVERARHLGLIN